MTSAQHDAPGPFRIELEPHRQTIVLVTHGEIDLASAGAVTGQVRDVLDAGFRRVVVDLRDVSFIDSSGLRAVLDARAASRDAQAEFALIAGPDPVQRLFELTGTSDILCFVDAATIDRA